MKIASKALLFSIFTFVSGCAHAEGRHELVSCLGHPDLQKKKSERLQEIAAEDQADRSGKPESIDWNLVTPRDLQRRVEVGEIFGLGCFSIPADYAAGAIVYQHGETADHAFQAFVWSKRGVELGDVKQKWLMGASLDRYLVRTGHRQLFATQYSKPVGEHCWCLEPVEETFSEGVRVSYVGKTFDQALGRLKKMNREIEGCKEVKLCAGSRNPSPKGTVPGFW